MDSDHIFGTMFDLLIFMTFIFICIMILGFAYRSNQIGGYREACNRIFSRYGGTTTTALQECNDLADKQYVFHYGDGQHTAPMFQVQTKDKNGNNIPGSSDKAVKMGRTIPYVIKAQFPFMSHDTYSNGSLSGLNNITTMYRPEFTHSEVRRNSVTPSNL